MSDAENLCVHCDDPVTDKNYRICIKQDHEHKGFMVLSAINALLAAHDRNRLRLAFGKKH